MVKRENFLLVQKGTNHCCFEIFRLASSIHATARVVQFKGILQQKRKCGSRIDDREMAKTPLYGQSQYASFPDTIKRLTTNKVLDSKDALLSYLPFLYGNLIRARARLRLSPMPDATKYPIVLHAKEPSIQLMIKTHIINACMHVGTKLV